MATRYVGDATVRIQYHETRGNQTEYRGTVTAGGKSWAFDGLCAPAAGFGAGVGYDSPEAYDSMAGAAVAFGSFYTSHNRPHDDASDCDWIPSADVADAIAEATAHAQDAYGRYTVRRKRPSQGA